MKCDITTLEDVQQLVDSFYARVREDEMLGPIFEKQIEDRWPVHLEKMYRFWQTVLLEEHTYSGSPFMPHLKLPIEALHFERWLQLFFATMDENFKGEKAEKGKWQGQRMAEMFHSKIQFYHNNPKQPIAGYTGTYNQSN